MAVKFSEDVIPLTNLKANPGRVVKQVAESVQPGPFDQPRTRSCSRPVSHRI